MRGEKNKLSLFLLQTEKENEEIKRRKIRGEKKEENEEE